MIIKLRRFLNITAGLAQSRGNLSHNAGAVIAVQPQYEAIF